MTPITLNIEDVAKTALAAHRAGNLQATRAQKDPAFRGNCYNFHPEDPSCHCVIGASLTEEIWQTAGRASTSFSSLVDMGIVEADDPLTYDQLVELQAVHDQACKRNKSAGEAFSRLISHLEHLAGEKA
jgi:hypothetical protein